MRREAEQWRVPGSGDTWSRRMPDTMGAQVRRSGDHGKPRRRRLYNKSSAIIEADRHAVRSLAVDGASGMESEYERVSCIRSLTGLMWCFRVQRTCEKAIGKRLRVARSSRSSRCATSMT